VQHRMAPHIARWPAARFYASRLLDAPSVAQPAWAPPPHLYSPMAYVFVDVPHAREVRDDVTLSVHSPAEADECMRVLRSLFASGAGAGLSVGLITFYAAQTRQLGERLAREGAAWASGVQVATVDAFQGQEKDVIVLSFVRANVRGAVGFLRDMRRLNVALTRARRLLVLVGHAPTLRAHPDLAHLLDDAATRKLLLTAPPPANARPAATPAAATFSATAPRRGRGGGGGAVRAGGNKGARRGRGGASSGVSRGHTRPGGV